MSDTRSEIYQFVQENPGIHFNAIGRGLDLATGQVQYHIRRLSKSNRVQVESVCGRMHYFPPTYSDWERSAIALLRRETSREIIILLLKDNSLEPQRIADRLDLARSTVEWHLTNLLEYGIARKVTAETGERHVKGNERVRVELEEPSRTYRLLREIDPSPADRLVDRFARFVDDLLEEPR